MGFPVLRTLSLCTCCRHYPGAAAGRRLRSSHPAVTAFPENVVGSACTSSFSRLLRRLLALRPAHSRRHLYVTGYTEGFSHFVTSMTAPVTSGWSVRRVGLHPLEKRRLLTAHTYCGHSRSPVDVDEFCRPMVAGQRQASALPRRRLLQHPQADLQRRLATADAGHADLLISEQSMPRTHRGVAVLADDHRA